MHYILRMLRWQLIVRSTRRYSQSLHHPSPASAMLRGPQLPQAPHAPSTARCGNVQGRIEHETSEYRVIDVRSMLRVIVLALIGASA